MTHQKTTQPPPGTSSWADLDLCAGMRRYVAEVEAVYASLPPDRPISDQRRTYDELARRYTRQRPSGVRVRDALIPAEGRSPVPARIYEPAELRQGPSPALVYFHGGGFALGSIESHDCVVAELALATGAVAISVAYRLAPEFPFPAAFEDAFAVWTAVQGRHQAIAGIDPARTIVAGDSAGAALAVAICLESRRTGLRQPAGQLLIYPALTAAADLPSYEDQRIAPLLTAAGLATFWDLYTEAGKSAGDPLAAPLRATDLSGLPPAFIATAHYDPCRDDGAEYARRLGAANVPVEYRCAQRLAHGYLRARSMSPAAAAEFASLGEGARTLLRRLGPAVAPRSAA